MVSWSGGGYPFNSARGPATTNHRSFGTDALTTTTEASGEGPAPFTGTWSLLSIHISANSLTTAALHFTSRIEGSAGNQDVNVAAGMAGEFQDASNTDSVTQGDKMAIREAVNAGGSGTEETAGVSWKYE